LLKRDSNRHAGPRATFHTRDTYHPAIHGRITKAGHYESQSDGHVESLPLTQFTLLPSGVV